MYLLHLLYFFFLMIRRPPRSTLFPTRRSSDLLDAVHRSGPVSVLDFSSDSDHNRSVLSLAGSPEAIRAACLALVAACIERIDLRVHTGAHPRMGAVDVLPLVPIRGLAMRDCVLLARDLGDAIAR